MKKILAVMMALCLLVSCAAVFAEEKPVLTMGTHATFPPYEFVEDNQIVGIDAEVAAAIADKLGMELEIVDMDFNALVAAVSSHKIDMAMAGMTVTEERLQSVNFSTTYALGVQVVIVKEGSPIQTLEDLSAEGAAYMIGVQEATTGDIYATGEFGEARISKFKNGNEAVSALAAGKVDCVIIDNEPAKAYVEANEGLTILETAYAEEEYAIAIALDNLDLLEKINAALEELIADGTVKGIVDKYIPAE